MHLKLHGEKWTTEEARKCKLCNKQFGQPALYRLHIREHYRVSRNRLAIVASDIWQPAYNSSCLSVTDKSGEANEKRGEAQDDV